MRTTSNIMPTKAFEIERVTLYKSNIQSIATEQCEIIFITNVKEYEHENEKHYEYDLYRLKAIYRETLIEDIETNYQDWLNKAIDEEGSV